jgi:CHAD domain-containing protein
VVREPVIDEVLLLLKTLQDVLGEFNDMSVQQQWLQDALQSQEVIRGPGVQAAIGGLMTSLYSHQQRSRQNIYSKFSGFVDRSVSSRIMHLANGAKERL